MRSYFSLNKSTVSNKSIQGPTTLPVDLYSAISDDYT